MKTVDAPLLRLDGGADRLLRCYHAERGDGWSGYVVAPRGWNGDMPLPSPPASTRRLAEILWFRQQARRTGGHEPDYVRDVDRPYPVAAADSETGPALAVDTSPEIAVEPPGAL